MRCIVPPAWLLAAVLLMTGLHVTVPGYSVVPSPFRLCGTALVVLGMLLVVWPAVLFHRARTPIQPFTPSTTLITSGPYRFTRNPIYLGMAVLLLGVAILFGSLTPFGVAVTFPVLIDRVFIVHEECLLLTTFAEPYRVYCRHVRRWVGRKRDNR